MNLLYHTDKQISFYKLGKNEMLPIRCKSRLIDIEKIVFDSASPGTIVALSKTKNLL
jgi:hypothetical protein